MKIYNPTSPMPKLRLLTVAFDARLEAWKIPALRGAIAAKAGLQHDLFHNHDNESGGFHYRYPLIQYKNDRGQPLLFCLDDGVEALHHFFNQPDWSLSLHGETLPVRIARLDVREHTLQACPDRLFTYHLRNWLPLNPDNFGAYQRLPGLVERLFLLQTILRNQLVGLLRDLDGQTPDTEIKAYIKEIKSDAWVSYKGVKVLAFSLIFETNVSLADLMGLGKGCSTGWGVVKRVGKGAVGAPRPTTGERPGKK